MTGILDECRVKENKKIDGEHGILVLESSLITRQIQPGQFVQIQGASSTDPLLRRPFSIYATDIKKGQFSILYKVVGKTTMLLCKKKKGERISVIGPLGKGFSFLPSDAQAILVGGGVGIAPLYLLAKTYVIQKRRADVQVLLGAVRKERLFAKKEFEALKVKVHTITDDGSCGRKGSVCDLLEEIIKGVKGKQLKVYACGPKPMLAKVQEILLHTHTEGELSLEEYMGCGVGVCMSCAVPVVQGGYKSVCVAGPVFDAKEVILYE